MIRLATRAGVPVAPDGRPETHLCIAAGLARFAMTCDAEPRISPAAATSNLEAMTRDDLDALYRHVKASHPVWPADKGHRATVLAWLHANHPQFFRPANREGQS